MRALYNVFTNLVMLLAQFSNNQFRMVIRIDLIDQNTRENETTTQPVDDDNAVSYSTHMPQSLNTRMTGRFPAASLE